MEPILAPSYNRATGRRPIALTCPVCSHQGTFVSFGVDDVRTNSHILGQRQCPNPDCHAHVFVVCSNPEHELLYAYPCSRIDFDTANIPENIVSCLTEAITCHANSCYRASAMLVRRTLEELCEEHEATGNTLKQKLNKLKEKIVLPQGLMKLLHDLRFLGNDAAHIKAKVFGDIGDKEVALVIKVTKEILKGLYQYESLVSELNSYKKNKEEQEEVAAQKS